MIIRIVKMTFTEAGVDNFLPLFESHKDLIRGFEGCIHLDLLQDISDPNMFMTYSYWESEDALENYRHSELFRQVWGQTKKLFDAKPEAWSVTRLHHLPADK